MAIVCKNCGVVLEDNMLSCPLCGEPVNGSASASKVHSYQYGDLPSFGYSKMTTPQRKITWGIFSLILLSAPMAALIVDFIINRHITWSEYPIAVCLTIFCYLSLPVFWHWSTLFNMAGGFASSSLCLVLLDIVTGGIEWSVRLGMPLLFISTLLLTVMIYVIRRSKYKGLNLIAYVLFATAVLCIGIDALLFFFNTGFLKIQWSIIVTACTIPVIIVLLFVHFKLRKGRSLEKTFHV